MLYLTEPIDEVAIQNLAEYNDKKFVDVSREGIDLGADDEDTKKVMLIVIVVCHTVQSTIAKDTQLYGIKSSPARLQHVSPIFMVCGGVYSVETDQC